MKEFQASLSEFNTIGKEIKSLVFVPIHEFQESEFGNLRLMKGSLVACAVYNDIQIWNVNSRAIVWLLL